MLDVYKMVARVAPTMSTVLVVGESGTGKELVARAIHTHSPRAQGPFVAVNCTALTESLLESELFGHAEGRVHRRGGAASAASSRRRRAAPCSSTRSATSAARCRRSCCACCRRARFAASAAPRPIKVDVRVVAATNRELEDEVEAGRFREDLYFRINVVTIRLPPLRERPSDIPLLVEHFLAKYAARERRDDAGDGAARRWRCLQRYAWPGNVRELENVIERALALSKDGVILPSDLPPEVAQEAATTGGAGRGGGGGLVDDRPTLAELERRYIELILRETGGNKKRAAEILGIDRRTLYRTLERTGGAAEVRRGRLCHMLSGTFATMPFADLLQWISDARRSGTLQVALEFEERYLRFVDGAIAAYGSDDPMARDLGRLCLLRGLCDERRSWPPSSSSGGATCRSATCWCRRAR